MILSHFASRMFASRMFFWSIFGYCPSSNNITVSQYNIYGRVIAITRITFVVVVVVRVVYIVLFLLLSFFSPLLFLSLSLSLISSSSFHTQKGYWLLMLVVDVGRVGKADKNDIMMIRFLSSPIFHFVVVVVVYYHHLLFDSRSPPLPLVNNNALLYYTKERNTIYVT